MIPGLLLRAFMGSVASKFAGPTAGRVAGVAGAGGLAALASNLFSDNPDKSGSDPENFLERNAGMLALAAGVLGLIGGKSGAGILTMAIAALALARYSDNIGRAVGVDVDGMLGAKAPNPAPAAP